jgi:microcin C transport system substrate-binding protein
MTQTERHAAKAATRAQSVGETERGISKWALMLAGSVLAEWVRHPRADRQ